jgi:galactokinase
MTIDLIINTFRKEFGEEPALVVRSPGRINIIGEHTDYNDGFVFPAAIDKEIMFAARPNDKNIFRFYSVDFNEHFEMKLRDLNKSEVQWANYLLGVADQFKQAGYELRGVDVAFGGNIPVGAGLSSSAAVETGFAKVLSELFDFNVTNLDLVKMSQKAEHEYAGVMCGIMDQFAIIHGKSGHALKLDCRTLDYEYAPVEMEDYQILLIDTKVKHALASSEYNTRRKECEQAVEVLKQYDPSVKALRDVTPELLKKHHFELEEKVYKRAKYVVEENIRVEKAFEALQNNDVVKLGKLMYETHIGLRDEYEVSCDELDILFDIAYQSEAVVGARMMGGGFGGCTINIVRNDGVDVFVENAAKEFEKKTGQKPEVYKVKISEGTGVLMDNK